MCICIYACMHTSVVYEHIYFSSPSNNIVGTVVWMAKTRYLLIIPWKLYFHIGTYYQTWHFILKTSSIDKENWYHSKKLKKQKKCIRNRAK